MCDLINTHTHTHTHTHTMVRFRGAREKRATVFVECLGVSQEDTMEGSSVEGDLRQ